MAQKLTGPMAEGLVIGDGYIVRFAAVDPTTGANVAGVVVSAVDVDAEDQGSGNEDTGTPILIGANV